MSKKNKVMRSTSHSLKFANDGKLQQLTEIVEEYRRVCQWLVDLAWSGEISFNGKKFDPTGKHIDIKSTYFDDQYLKMVDTWLSARMLQCIGKQAVGMLKSACKKQSKRYYMLKKLQKEGKPTKYLQRKIDRTPLVKPECFNINMELDGRFSDIRQGKHFDEFIRISSIGNKVLLNLPIKHTKCSRKWVKQAKRLNSIRLNEHTLSLLYEFEPKQKQRGKTLAIDQGSTTCCTVSDGQTTKPCKHGHDLKSIQKKLSRCKKGSKGFKRAQKHRTNYINWSINQLDFRWVKEIRLEKLHDIGRGKRKSRSLSHWTYTMINDKIKQRCEFEGLKVLEIPNEFRSQRCNRCGWVQKSNRKSKQFCCRQCGHSADADDNAAQNLLLDLAEIDFFVRQGKYNREGFFWDADGIKLPCGEPIVSHNEKVKDICTYF